LSVFLTGALLTILLGFTNNSYLSWAIGVATLALFVYLVVIDSDFEKRRKKVGVLIKINEEALKRRSGDWKQFVDTGSEFSNHSHPFSGDLDLFGHGSLFQWTSVARTFLGRKRLAAMLSEPLKEIDSITQRQEAILELSKKLVWRQRFQAEAESVKEKAKNIEALSAWSHIQYGFYELTWVKGLVYLLPLTTAVLLVGSIFLKSIPSFLPITGIFLQILLLRVKKNEHKEALDTIYPYKKTLATYEQLLMLLEEEGFQAEALDKLKASLETDSGQKASRQIHKLGKIVDGISNRMNAMYLILDVLLLWDFHLMIALEKWKVETGHLMVHWIEVIAEIEALNSLSVIAYDHSTWCLPRFEKSGGVVSQELGHPLLGNGRKSNPLILQQASTLLITGSNMSGKSTLLRTVGINLVLAYTGTVVCAKSFSCGMMDIFTCMRVQDDLEQSISSFYAELLRIKQMVSLSKEKANVFFLLDEVFKGTNSEDRHQGAKILIGQLNRQGATGLVSTHDLELGAMEAATQGLVKNFHFRETYEDNQIHFDYVLRPGISTTKNAMYLIKMAGIDVD
ncbi:MAG: DNA mismatch repair protein, partial [Vallitaleaceae bacterium]|nr:DNA mismatch repair protein [Vallitaleaceae bacterium]